MAATKPEKVAVIGFGVTGQAAVRYLLSRGSLPVVVDTRAQPPTELPCEVETYFSQQSWPNIDVSTAILSPGLAMDSCLVTGAKRAGVTLESDIDIFFRSVHTPVIAITGTNGKSTVTSWVAHCLNAAGVVGKAGGNLGEAALDLLQQPAQVYVLELSSFQLERSRSHPFAVATVLNVSEDHVDQHLNMQHYIAAKQRIYARAKRCVINRLDDNSTGVTDQSLSISFGLDRPDRPDAWGIISDGTRRFIGQGDRRLLDVDELKLHGLHNQENALATAAIASQFMPFEQIATGLKSFTGLAHRFEVVAKHDGVTYVNDSKATNVGATAAALQGFQQERSVVLIVGGDAKGADVSVLADVASSRVKAFIALGRDAPAFARLAENVGSPCVMVDSLSDAVTTSKKYAVSGNTVLLSPACASLDMFANYADRGDQFRTAVAALVKESEVRS